MESATSGRVVLIILDGFGLRASKKGNAVLLAGMKNYENILKTCPNSLLKAGGESDGLIKGTIGNSEVGHLNIGAGRIVFQNDTKITNAINDGTFYKNKAFLEAIEKVKKQKSTLHMIGLISDKGVHSRITHLFALMKIAKKQGVKCYIHAITDGRDTEPRVAINYLKMLQKEIRKQNNGIIATTGGRYYYMDRDARWDRTGKALEAIEGKGKRKKNGLQAIKDSYKEGKEDEFIEPCVLGDYRGITKNDMFIAFNFRPDRMRQICSLLEKKAGLTTMTQYDSALQAAVAFPPETIKNFLGEVLANNNKQQLRIAETEKYAHVTYFFNGQIETPMKQEERILISSPKVATYDLAPEMKATEITETLIKAMKQKKYSLITVNFANPDMVGHTGKISSAVKALQTIDECLKKIVEARTDEIILITSDHGNCEEMEGKHQTSHTLNPVPFILIGKKFELGNGIHADVAPTVLDILGIAKPKEMSGESLIKRK